ncbi:hypothetical protein DCMF_08430 [Candidatus Formimonas warabiya]|uniref:Peptidase S7 domain-containing protein n=1 Tax=Formimonas warabiya TaxID=1761012 RepID=A0A3G1KQS5_FORW1|nr:hypothetical protein DCMF_08430 [Candidatus Formimonas warabiya]
MRLLYEFFKDQSKLTVGKLSYIYKGSSGSPVINSRGKVVGIVFASLDKQNKEGPATGFAISVDSLKKKLQEQF